MITISFQCDNGRGDDNGLCSWEDVRTARDVGAARLELDNADKRLTDLGWKLEQTPAGRQWLCPDHNPDRAPATGEMKVAGLPASRPGREPQP